MGKIIKDLSALGGILNANSICKLLPKISLFIKSIKPSFNSKIAIFTIK